MPNNEQKPLCIALDGPSGAGKSTVARALAEQLCYTYVESGAMYRAVALLAKETGTDLGDGQALAKLAESADIRFQPSARGPRLLLDGRDVTEAVRSPEITEASSRVSVHVGVRKWMVERQRAFAVGGGVVMEGRDIGTVVLPDAEVKIFLDASPPVRAERRLRDPDAAGQQSPETVLAAIRDRDRRDQTRQVSPLVPAPDAVRIDTTSLSAEQVVEQILNLINQRLAARARQEPASTQHAGGL
jgi:cytidylate kinase